MLWGLHSRTHSTPWPPEGVEWVLWWLREILVSLALKDLHFVLKREEKTSWWAVMVSGEIVLLSWFSKELSSCEYLPLYSLSWSMKPFHKLFLSMPRYSHHSNSFKKQQKNQYLDFQSMTTKKPRTSPEGRSDNMQKKYNWEMISILADISQQMLTVIKTDERKSFLVKYF